METQRRYILENVMNCRDLGGYPSKYGVTKYGRFIRGGTVTRPTDYDIQSLNSLGVKTVIDLRGDFEAQNQPNNFERLTDNVHQISLYEINVADVKTTTLQLSDIYKLIVDSYKDNIAKALKTIAEAPDGAIFYHCFLGKDRTGILSLMLLTIAGVDEDDIVADYQLTFTYLEKFIRNHSDKLWETDMTMHYSLPQTMRELIEYINEKYGSVLDYIGLTGVTEAEIEKIRKRFY